MLPLIDVLLQGRGAPSGAGDLLWIVYLLVLVIDILIIVAIWRSRKTTLVKVVWTLVIVFTSVIGWILYFFLGREK